MNDKRDELPKIENSCGCIFCDIGDTPRDFQGKPAHYRRDHTVFICTKGAVQSSSGPN